MGHIFAYPATVTDEGADGITITFDDIPEAISGAFDKETALKKASDALDEAIAVRMRLKEDIPAPRAAYGDPLVAVSPLIGAKAALYLAAADSGKSHKALAEFLGLDPKDLRRMLNPRHGTQIDAINRALEALGVRLVVGFNRAA